MKAAVLSIVLAACHPAPAPPPVSNHAPAVALAPAAEPSAEQGAGSAESPPDAGPGAGLDAGSAADTVARLEQFADAMCQCADRDCAERVVDDMSRWAQDLAASGQAMPKVTGAEDARARAATQRMTQCMTTVYKRRAGSAAP